MNPNPQGLTLSPVLCVLILALNAPLSQLAIAAQQPETKSVLDWLLAGQVFSAKAVNLKIDEPPNSTRSTFTNETIWADSIAAGLYPKYHRYFMFRAPSNPTRDVFDIVFFDEEHQGFFLGIRRATISEMNASRIASTYTTDMGGEAGTGIVKRTLELSPVSDSAAACRLSASIESEEVWRTIWRLYRSEKIIWRVEMQFEPVDVPQSLLAAAGRISMDLVEFTKLEEQKLHEERKRSQGQRNTKGGTKGVVFYSRIAALWS